MFETRQSKARRNPARLLRILFSAIAMTASLIGGPPAHANRMKPTTDPVLDGNIDDVLLRAHEIMDGGQGIGIVIVDPVMDVGLADTAFLPCDGILLHSPRTGLWYFPNGFDIAKVALATAGGRLWLGMRVYGQIGDTDGDGTDSAGIACPARDSGRMPEDPAGIGEGEQYVFSLDTDCDASANYEVSVHGGAGTGAPSVIVTDGSGAPVAVASAAARYAGSDLEICIAGLSLPAVVSLSAIAASPWSGLSEDRCGPLRNSPSVTLDLAREAQGNPFYLGEPKWVSFRVTNGSTVPVAISVFDVMPPDWDFTGSWRGDLPLKTAQDGRLIFSSPQVAAGSTAAVQFEVVVRQMGAQGENRSYAQALYTNPCPAQTILVTTDTLFDSWAASVAPVSSIGPATPNPFRASTELPLAMGGSVADHVRIFVFDAAGRRVRTLVDDICEPGQYALTWDGRRDDGVPAGGGLYFVKAWVGARSLPTNRILRLR